MDLIIPDLFGTKVPKQAPEPPKEVEAPVEQHVHISVAEPEEEKKPDRHPACYITKKHPRHTFMHFRQVECGGAAAVAPVKVKVFMRSH